jgi:hypothetical protein
VSYLLDYARHPMLGRRARNARVDERLRLNHPQFDGGAEVRVFVEDTSRMPHREVAPRIRFRISDCAHQVNLEFGVESPELRANALFKIDTLLDALSKFRDGLIAEAALFEQRQRR